MVDHRAWLRKMDDSRAREWISCHKEFEFVMSEERQQAMIAPVSSTDAMGDVDRLGWLELFRSGNYILGIVSLLDENRNFSWNSFLSFEIVCCLKKMNVI